MLDSIDWRHYARDAQMVVLSADPRIPVDDLPQSTIRLAYVSVGEADPRRPYWSEVRGQPFLVEPNPEWPDNLRVDIRDTRWQEVLLCEEIARLMQRGFDGLMLDTVDTVPYLETKDPARFAGSRQALRDWLQRLRKAFPRAVLVANGSDALVDAAPYVDAFVVEGVFSIYDVRQRAYRRTTDVERDWKLGAIARARAVAPRPVFTIEYADVGDVELVPVGRTGIAPPRISSLCRSPRAQHRALIRRSGPRESGRGVEGADADVGTKSVTERFLGGPLRRAPRRRRRRTRS